MLGAEGDADTLPLAEVDGDADGAADTEAEAEADGEVLAVAWSEAETPSTASPAAAVPGAAVGSGLCPLVATVTATLAATTRPAPVSAARRRADIRLLAMATPQSGASARCRP